MHTEMVYQNPHAEGQLRYGLDVVCNVDDEKILSNCLVNSLKVKTWANSKPENGKTLLICGSGPSIKDDLPLIKSMVNGGAEIWALNNCCRWLNDQGIIPDAQVIMDALPVTANAIGQAKNHLFASQVDPSLFDAVPDAILWHSTHGNVKVDEQEGFPDYADSYCLIGSAVSVGNTAMVLGYSQGFRDIHLFGYDSSNNDASSHVKRQEWNDGEPMTIREFMGKKYECSLTMSLQADAFPSRAAVLIKEGCNISVHGYGLLPDRWNAKLTEEQKYSEIWKMPEYGEVSPGELSAHKFVEVVKPGIGRVIADFGCGSGKGGLALSKLTECEVILIDFAENSRIEEAKKLQFIKANLSNHDFPLFVDFGYCTDVMEHIPTDLVDSTIKNIMSACVSCFFQISTIPDEFGAAIGQPLHLTVKPHQWWKEKFVSLGHAVLWEEENETTASFHIA